ncbi:Vegetative incompatibility protein HET-E-1 [Pseudocercospora fuligena]|uniref:Vegetative incompatibility protein HET-E-1 n=1 Tax=Pseudocercospora fuligena TaxID=685502 RepID=A0A8H6VG48_9PEZI|nr:Vegetative incompatibility protein HET-E-1 [Pseudocercospora fuligena]
MRLINATTFTFADYDAIKSCRYAIVSHCWGEQEVTLQEFNTIAGRDRSGWSKIEQACRLAKAQGYDWVWIDACCIDRTSSAELSQAINSLFEWYRRAQECFVFLPDVSSTEADESFKRSRWFRRGWTLQELLAPASETFYNSRYEHIGTKVTLSSQISEATGIDARYLDRGRDMKEIHDASLAERMSWASKRSTKEPEDIAYCLLGIFKVNMPLLYGEGATRAFIRLQLQITKQSDDESIFAWPEDPENTEEYPGVLAQHPRAFAGCGLVMPLQSRRHPAHAFTSRGMELYISSSWLSKASDTTRVSLESAPDQIVRLDCEVSDPEPARLAIILRRSTNTGEWYRLGCQAYKPESELWHFLLQFSRIYVPQPELGQTGLRHLDRASGASIMSIYVAFRSILEISTILVGYYVHYQFCNFIGISDSATIPAMQLVAWSSWSILWCLTGLERSFLVKVLGVGLVFAVSSLELMTSSGTKA